MVDCSTGNFVCRRLFQAETAESDNSKWIATTNVLLTMNQTMLQETYGAPFMRAEIKNKQLRIIRQGMIEGRIIFASQLKMNASSIGNGL